MAPNPNIYLIIASACSAAAAALHLGCMVFGAPWYRFFGAGEQMARLAESGSTYPTRITAVIATMLLVWSAYALSGAGVIPRLPFLRPVLCLIASAYLLRGFLFFPLISRFPENSFAFWMWSGGICAAFGLVHALGIKQAWPHL